MDSKAVLAPGLVKEVVGTVGTGVGAGISERLGWRWNGCGCMVVVLETSTTCAMVKVECIQMREGGFTKSETERRQ